VQGAGVAPAAEFFVATKKEARFEMPNAIPGCSGVSPPAALALAPAIEVRFEVVAAIQRPARFKRFAVWALRALAALTRPGPVWLHVRSRSYAGGKEVHSIEAWRQLGEPTLAIVAIAEPLVDAVGDLAAGGNWEEGFGAGRLVGRHEVINPPRDVRFN